MLGETNSLAGISTPTMMTYDMLKNGGYTYNDLAQYTHERLKTKIPPKTNIEGEVNES